VNPELSPPSVTLARAATSLCGTVNPSTLSFDNAQIGGGLLEQRADVVDLAQRPARLGEPVRAVGAEHR